MQWLQDCTAIYLHTFTRSAPGSSPFQPARVWRRLLGRLRFSSPPLRPTRILRGVRLGLWLRPGNRGRLLLAHAGRHLQSMRHHVPRRRRLLLFLLLPRPRLLRLPGLHLKCIYSFLRARGRRAATPAGAAGAA